MIKFLVNLLDAYDTWEHKCIDMYGYNAGLVCTVCLGILIVTAFILIVFIVIGLIAFIFA